MRRLTQEEFLSKTYEVHRDTYDYSLVHYIKNSVKIIIICKEHGEFLQAPRDHLVGKGCPKCGRTQRLTINEFIEKAKEIHDNEYDYSKVIYKNAKTRVIIRCSKHGDFLQLPDAHLRGYKCNLCSIKLTSKTTEQFIIDAQTIHGNLYDYSLVDYTNAETNIRIICPSHGIFEQKPRGHLEGKGCHKCKSSWGEIKIRQLLSAANIKFIEEYRFSNQPKEIKFCRYDFYLSEFNMIIEYHGRQHYEFLKFFHKSIMNFHKRCAHDIMKWRFCLEQNITFITINYSESIIERINQLLQHIQIAGTP